MCIRDRYQRRVRASTVRQTQAPTHLFHLQKKNKTFTMVDVSDPALAQAYQDVRSDANPTSWVIFGYSGNKIVVDATGSGDYAEFASHFDDSKAQYGFVRVTTGDSESKRAKFVFIAWVGTGVSPLARAKVSVHKANVKQIVRDYAAEVHAEAREEIDEQKVMDKVVKAGGANYGTGVRN
eukprot:TRINITY_DN16603_c0_g1_i1.p1 TRINITY_DN16603_c0_g1~~TRINITY_DN16603_c0_g1_i1.p1  ORF type:complete len:180 (-),score=34.36 TRINITY_DN16603_c0_g1_i1:104-643(-)